MIASTMMLAAVLPVGEDGALGAVCNLLELKGQIGPNRVEQPFSKPHQNFSSPEGRFVIVPERDWTAYSPSP